MHMQQAKDTDEDLPFDQLNTVQEKLSVQEKLLHFGLVYPPNDTSANLKMMRPALKETKEDIEKGLSPDQVSVAIGSKP